jgi:hypothetical protein
VKTLFILSSAAQTAPRPQRKKCISWSPPPTQSQCKFHPTLDGARNSQSESKNALYFSVSNDLSLERNVQKIASWRIFQMHSERGREQLVAFLHSLCHLTLCLYLRFDYSLVMNCVLLCEALI